MGKAPDNLSSNLDPRKTEREMGFLKSLEIGKTYTDNKGRIFMVVREGYQEYSCMSVVIKGKSKVRQEELTIAKSEVEELQISELLIE